MLDNEAAGLTMGTDQTCLMYQVGEGHLRAHRRHRTHLHQIVRRLFVDDGALEMPTGSRGGLLTMIHAHDMPRERMLGVARLGAHKRLVAWAVVSRDIGRELEVGI